MPESLEGAQIIDFEEKRLEKKYPEDVLRKRYNVNEIIELLKTDHGKEVPEAFLLERALRILRRRADLDDKKMLDKK